MADDWRDKTRDLVLERENRAFAFPMPSLRDVADRMHAESRLDSVVGGCFICRDPLTSCPTPEECGIQKPVGDARAVVDALCAQAGTRLWDNAAAACLTGQGEGVAPTPLLEVARG